MMAIIIFYGQLIGMRSPAKANLLQTELPLGRPRRLRGIRKGEATRQSILRHAARAIREAGPEQVGVADVMRAAGLTHGGFYAHFPSKDALVAGAIEGMFAEGAARFAAVTGAATGKAALKAWIQSYLSPDHRDNRAGGCAVAALNTEASRLEPVARAAFEAGLRGIAARFVRHLSPPLPPEEAEAAAWSLMAELSGTLALARVTADPKLSNRILEAGRDAAMRRLDALLP